jgi:chitin disaccharide deacetylase
MPADLTQALRPIVLCADDYAHTAPISGAILDLARRGRISALSCMTASALWPAHGPWLEAVRDTVDIGLHLTLVDETPLTHMPKTAPGGKLPDISTLIRRSYLGQLDHAEIDGEIRAQIASFVRVTGFAPHHIDGHLHAHVLPGIRDMVLTHARAMSPRPWVRTVGDKLGTIIRRGVAVPKATFLAVLGRGLAQAAGGDRINTGFSGLYDFSSRDRDYGALFECFLEGVGTRHVILCHPGEAEDGAAHAALRSGEYTFFKSDAFLHSLVRHNLRLGRFADMPA